MITQRQSMKPLIHKQPILTDDQHINNKTEDGKVDKKKKVNTKYNLNSILHKHEEL